MHYPRILDKNFKWLFSHYTSSTITIKTVHRINIYLVSFSKYGGIFVNKITNISYQLFIFNNLLMTPSNVWYKKNNMMALSKVEKYI